MNFYTVVLAIHNIVRWIVIILAILALARAYIGWLGRKNWTGTDRMVGVLFTSMMDLQLLLGLILFFVVGVGRGPFLYEHVIPMVVAVILSHIGSARARRLEDDTAKHRQAAIWYTLAVLVVLISIPWPPRRPLLPRL